MVEPSASVAGADWLGRPWAPSGPASGCPRVFFGLEVLLDCLAAPFFLSWFFIVVCNVRLGADPIETNTLAIFQTLKFFAAWIRNPNTGRAKLLETNRQAFPGGSQRFSQFPVRHRRLVCPGAREERPPFSRSHFPAQHGPLTTGRARDRFRARD